MVRRQLEQLFFIIGSAREQADDEVRPESPRFAPRFKDGRHPDAITVVESPCHLRRFSAHESLTLTLPACSPALPRAQVVYGQNLQQPRQITRTSTSTGLVQRQRTQQLLLTLAQPANPPDSPRASGDSSSPVPTRSRRTLRIRSPTFFRGPAVVQPAVVRPDPDKTGEEETGEGGDAGPADEVVGLNEDLERAGGGNSG